MIAVVDYGAGNIRSVLNALKFLGASACLTSDKDVIASSSGVVLPGVGSFGKAMERLEERGLCVPVKEAALKKKPFLGICLGLQLLFQESEESPGVQGLGIFEGKVKRIESLGKKVPHMGWSTVEKIKGDSAQNAFYYFVHSYAVCPQETSVIAGTCVYGQKFTAAVERGNLFACQFHPEKSGRAGLEILEKFIKKAEK